MPTDPRTPVLVGVGQLTRHPTDAATASEPAEMMADVLRLAAADAKADGLLARADAVRVVSPLSWRYADPGRTVAERLGTSPRSTAVSATGGNGPQVLVSRTALDILAGRLDVALLVGGEAVSTRHLARKQGAHLDWTPLATETAPAVEVIGLERPGTNDLEQSVGLVLPPMVYPLFENALRAAAGESIAEHQAKVARLWARFSDVAARNPHAWSPVAKSADEIATPTPDNRMIAFPYTKWMNANIQVDQAAGMILCSLDAARAAGVPDDRMVFPLSGADAHDHWWISSRADLHSSPAIRLAGRAALANAGRTIDDVGHIDLYSCFPSAVQMGAEALGLPLDGDRELTVTGGLTFAGGPANNYVSHSIAAMVERLRANPGDVGLVTALGWYATKHSVGLYATEPPAGGFVRTDVQAEVDALPSRAFTDDLDGAVTVESCTATYERDGTPSRGVAACLSPDGTRGWATTTEPDVLEAMVTTELCGRAATITGGTLHPA